MAPFSARRRRKVASGIVRVGVVLAVVLVTAFALHHPVGLVLQQLVRLAHGSSGSSSVSSQPGRTGSTDGRSLTGTV